MGMGASIMIAPPMDDDGEEAFGKAVGLLREYGCEVMFLWGASCSCENQERNGGGDGEGRRVNEVKDAADARQQ